MRRTDPTQRASGLLLHPTSLATDYGIGDLGQASRQWLDFLAQSGTALWQVLPLGPTGYGDSPYQCFSSYAGNPLLISPEELHSTGLIRSSELDEYPVLPTGHVDYGRVISAKSRLMGLAAERFYHRQSSGLSVAFESFVESNRWWLEEYALFMALKEAHGGRAWTEWDLSLRDRHQPALKVARARLRDAIDVQRFGQFVFYQQWGAVRRYAAKLGITIVGDIPVYVAGDSADVWTRQDLFQLDAEGRPTVVAGVPPDYFSETGQLWGNPIYAWETHAAEGYEWWIKRLRRASALADVVRIDHFRAFVDYWEIPAEAPTAETGGWVDGPGRGFFDAVGTALNGLPFIAEDLGKMNPAVAELRDELHLPGMKILQFAFATDESDPFLPHMYPESCVAYTGTHDNEPINGWWQHAPSEEREFALRYLQWDGTDPAGRFTEALWGSRANWALAQMQDLLRLDSADRMNTPSTTGNNWRWRLAADQLTPLHGDELRGLNERHARVIST